MSSSKTASKPSGGPDPRPASENAPKPIVGLARGISAPHGYDVVSVEGMVANVAAANPGEKIVLVEDFYGLDVVPLRKLPRLSDEELEALLAGDRVTLLDGSRVELAKVPS